MKKIILIICMFCAFSAIRMQGHPLDSISTRRLLRIAHNCKYGIGTSVDLEKAAYIYKYLARKMHVVGMRELGLMYIKGEGVERNAMSARRLLNEAAACGDKRAMCELGRMYQFGDGVGRNLTVAYACYKEAADRGSAQGCYGAGYLTYKGMGVKQDYAKAVELLEKGSSKNHPGCSFLLGTYYAHGYDTTPDYKKAEMYFNRAVKNGHGWTVDLTKNNVLDSIKVQNANAKTEWKTISSSYRNARRMKAMCRTASRDSIADTWSGKVYTYDWSGTKILKEEELSMYIALHDSMLSVRWMSGDDVRAVFVSDKRTDNRWSRRRITDEEKQLKWVISNMSFEFSPDNTLYARISTAKTSTREKRKPMVAMMHRDFAATGIEVVSWTDVPKIVPMPVTDDRFTVNITAHKQGTVHISIYSISGAKVADCGSHDLSEGANSITVNAALAKGQYILSIDGEGMHESVNIIHL